MRRSGYNRTASVLMFLVLAAACSPFLGASPYNDGEFTVSEQQVPNKYWAPYHHLSFDPAVEALGITILVDELGNPWTDTGERVVVVDKGGDLTKVYRINDTVYLVLE